MHGGPERNRNRRESEEAAEDVNRPAGSPSDAVAGRVEPPDKQEGSDRNGHAKENGEDVSQPTAGKRPEPVRRRKFHGRPHRRDRDVVLPRAGGLAASGGRQRQGAKNKGEDRRDTRQRKGARPDRIGQVCKKGGNAEKKARRVVESSADEIEHAARGEQNESRKINRKCG